ncbi:MAG: hypothetical protein ACR2FH_11465 [Caulobacteraceae bacterium]
MMAIADLVYERVKTMPEPLAREVLDFVGFWASAGIGRGGASSPRPRPPR